MPKNQPPPLVLPQRVPTLPDSVAAEPCQPFTDLEMLTRLRDALRQPSITPRRTPATSPPDPTNATTPRGVAPPPRHIRPLHNPDSQQTGNPAIQADTRTAVCDAVIIGFIRIDISGLQAMDQLARFAERSALTLGPVIQARGAQDAPDAFARLVRQMRQSGCHHAVTPSAAHLAGIPIHQIARTRCKNTWLWFADTDGGEL